MLVGVLAVLNLLVVGLQIAHAHALRSQVRPPRRALVAARVGWFLGLGASVFFSYTEGNHAIANLATGLTMAFNGYISSRLAAFPRLATALLIVMWASLTLGLLVSPFEELRALWLLVPPGLAGFYLLMQLQHQTLLTAIRSQQENLRLARHDPLTGLPNRLALAKQLTMMCEGLSSHLTNASRFAVLALDLDAFKPINDIHGHSAGDRLLQEVSSRLQKGVRSLDVAARVGGDEFVILLPGADARIAAETARRLIDAVREEVALSSDVSVRPMLSVGIAIAPDDGTRESALLKAADNALYAAKKAGKGRWANARGETEAALA